MSDLENMPIELERQLMALGLTNYQARVYRAVFILKECSISQIANFSKVPTAKVYSTVSDLKEMGLIAEVLKSRPAMFTAYPPDQFIEREKNRIIDIGTQIKENLEELEKFRDKKETNIEHETLLIENELLIKNLILDSLLDTPTNVIILLQNDFDFYEDLLSRLAQKVDKGKTTVILINPYKRNLEFLKKYNALNFILLSPQQLTLPFTGALQKIPLLFILNEKCFINITQSQGKLEYLYLKSQEFADFLRYSLQGGLER